MTKSDNGYSLSFLNIIESLPHCGQVILKFFLGVFLIIYFHFIESYFKVKRAS